MNSSSLFPLRDLNTLISLYEELFLQDGQNFYSIAIPFNDTSIIITRNTPAIRRRLQRPETPPLAVRRQPQKRPRVEEGEEELRPCPSKQPRVVSVDPWFESHLLSNGQPVVLALQHKMIRMAQAIARTECAEDWQTFLISWRKAGYLASSFSTTVGPYSLSSTGERFRRVYEQVEASEMTDHFQAIIYRYQLIDLWQCYRETQQLDLPLTQGHRKLSRQKHHLFGLVHPGFRHIEHPLDDLTSRSTWHLFSHRLTYASRWHLLQEHLGRGVPGLMPNRVISNSWVHQLSREHLMLWIQAILHFNPTCADAGARWYATIRRALDGEPPDLVPTTLETMSTATLGQHANIFLWEDHVVIDPSLTWLEREVVELQSSDWDRPAYATEIVFPC